MAGANFVNHRGLAQLIYIETSVHHSFAFVLIQLSFIMARTVSEETDGCFARNLSIRVNITCLKTICQVLLDHKRPL
jgi:hypothetical protein